jgi:acetyl esterase
MERKPGSSPDLSKCGPMFGQMVAFIEKHVRV